MGKAINACTLSGYVQRTPKCGVSQNGTRWVKFTLRVSDSQYNPMTHRYEDTLQFVDCLAFNDDADYLTDNGISKNRKIVGTFTLRMEPRVITDSGTGESRVITIPTFIAKRGQIYIVEASRRDEWHADGWEPATM